MSRAIGAIFFLAAFSVADDAAEKVQAGIGRFEAGDLKGASRLLAEAEVARPEDLVITFDRACVYAAQGDVDKAIEAFRRVTSSKDRDLAAKADYNLGTIAASQARAVFGEKPEEAAPETRQKGLELLAKAVRQFRDCLELQNDHEPARRNIELIRLWIKQMEAVWRERDRQKAREEMDLLRFIQWLQGRQSSARAAVRALSARRDSPLRRQALSKAEEEQSSIAEEIESLKQKIDEAVSQNGASAQSSQAASGAPEKNEEVAGILRGWADEAYEAMGKAASLCSDSPEEAWRPQTEALEALNRVFGVVAPYPTLLQKTLATQQIVVDGTVSIVEGADTTDVTAGERDRDFESLAWSQKQTGQWVDGLLAKASQGSTGTPAGGKAAPGGQQTDQQEASEKIEASMKKAVELCPKIHALSAQAEEALRKPDAATALPAEEDALKLLKEIAESLPKDDQKQKGDSDQQQKDDSDRQQQQDQQQKQRQNQQQDLSRRQAEALLQKARERERKHRDQLDKLQGDLVGPSKVEKDW